MRAEEVQQKVRESECMELCYACKRVDTAEIRRLVSIGYDVNHADYDNRTPLHVAACVGCVQCLRTLVEAGASPTVTDRFRHTPLAEAVRSRRPEAIRFLRELGDDMGSMDVAYTFCSAASRGDIELLRMLLLAECSPNISDYDCRTGLHIAKDNGHSEAQRVLLEAGADPTLKDRWGATAI